MKKVEIVMVKDGETVNIGKHKAKDRVFVDEGQATTMIKRGDAKKAAKPKEEKVDVRK